MTATSASRPSKRDLVGIIPAAGWARRSPLLPCSKEIFPVGFRHPVAEELRAPKPACGYLLEAMRATGAWQAVVGLRAGKWDIPAHLGDGASYGLSLAYTVTVGSSGVPWTVRQTLSFAARARVLFGFPDIVFHPTDALARVERRQRERGADVVLGLFPARHPNKMDMVSVDDEGVVEEIVIKPELTALHHTWILAVWTPVFSAFLDAYLRRSTAAPSSSPEPELHLGDVFRAALGEGWRIESEEIPEGRYYDIGTPEELAQALHEFG